MQCHSPSVSIPYCPLNFDTIDELEQPATSSGRPKTMLATEVVETHSTSPSTTFATPEKLVAGHRRQNKQRERERERESLTFNQTVD
jgi:hypothetical protein